MFIRKFWGLWALVNNAGIVGGNVAWDDWLRPEDYEDTWQVNAMGVIRVTHAFKGLVKAEKGRIISTASVCGRIALPALGPYSVSKFALEAYCDTLRVEMHLFDVKVIILEPGFYNVLSFFSCISMRINILLKTPLTNVERNKEMLGRVWSRLPEALKNEYGEAFFKFCIFLNLQRHLIKMNYAQKLQRAKRSPSTSEWLPSTPSGL